MKIFKELKKLKLIKNYGVSIYNPASLKFLMKNYKNLTIQFPINFVDYRWSKFNIKKLKIKSKSILIGRSIFLRGKLLDEGGFLKNNKINKCDNKIKNPLDLRLDNGSDICSSRLRPILAAYRWP